MNPGTEINPTFVKALLAEDEVGCVIRSHLYVEAQIDRYLGLAVVEPKHLVGLDLSYAKKVELLCCLGFDRQFRGSLKRIGKLRNEFAHDLSSRLTQEAVSDLYNALPDFGRQAVHVSVDLLHQALGAAGQSPKYDTLPAKLQFVLVVLNVERICCAACELLQDAKKRRALEATRWADLVKETRMTANTNTALAYEAFMGRWSKVVAHYFLAWLSVPPHGRWLDVGCGTGALASAILQSASPSEVWGIDPSEQYIAHARAILPKDRCHLLVADAQALPDELSGFDATVSGLALNLVPDPIAAVDEMVRVTRPNGLVGAYVWDFAGGMQLLRYLWDAATKLDPTAEELDQGKCFPICHPDRLRLLFTEAGLRNVQVRPLEVPTIFCNFDDYWTPLLTGHGRAPSYVMSLSADQRSRLRESIQEVLPTHADGSIHLTARAWAVSGTKG